ncbi:hypothetical protein ONE63_007134 [Megalurothrips usitatus]|uniref:C2H2-type domain-containing protein n=1 Tax=Megalurothrips usitatus TaxID=439358 RepID=A0AAV7XUC8_9NEOP|nr:hypothetical protein ONE63_007134 [Megalurothrips usitatus]
MTRRRHSGSPKGNRGRNMTHVSPCVLQFAGKMVGTDGLEVQLTAEDHAAYGASTDVMTGTTHVLTAASPGLQDSQHTLQTLHPDVSSVITQTVQVSEALTNVIQPGISTITPTRKLHLKQEANIAWLEQEIKDFEVPKCKIDTTTLLLCPWCSIPYAAPMYLERHKKQCRKRLETVTLEEAQSQVEALAQAQVDAHIEAQGHVHATQIVQLQAAEVQPAPVHTVQVGGQVQASQVQTVQLVQGGQVQVAHVNGQPVMLSVDKMGHVCGVSRTTCNRCSPTKVLRNSITPSITVEEVPIDIATQLFTQERDITDSVVFLDRPYCFTLNNKGYLTADTKPITAPTVGKQFVCSECGERFSRNSLLKEHAKIHAGEKPYGCIECGMRFACSTQLKDHCRLHAGEKPFGCTDCGLWFSSSEHLDDHFQSHHQEKEFDEFPERVYIRADIKDVVPLPAQPVVKTKKEKPFHCTDCGERFAQNSDLKRHAVAHSGDKHFSCGECGQRFTRSSHLKEHSRVHTGEKPYGCTSCGERFTRSKSLRRHSLVHTGVKPFPCTFCKERFTQNSDLKRHLLIHTGEKPFVCSECGERYTRSSGLKEHFRVHTGEKPFCCNDCGQRFTHNSDLKRHVRIHSGVKPFSCNDCGERFTQNSDLKRHKRIHTGEKPYGCSECGERFTRSSGLKEHYRTHTGEKPYICTECGQRFIKTRDLKRHSRIHTGEKPFACTECPQTFTQNSDLKRHAKVHQQSRIVSYSETIPENRYF